MQFFNSVSTTNNVPFAILVMGFSKKSQRLISAGTVKDNKLKEKPEAPTLTVRSASVCERSLQINIKLVIFIL